LFLIFGILLPEKAVISMTDMFIDKLTPSLKYKNDALDDEYKI